LPSIFFITGISIATVSLFYSNRNSANRLIAVLIFLSIYWLWGKSIAGRNYGEASLYAKTIESKVEQHFKNTSDTLCIDTLRVTVHGLPVFRVRFKNGINWLNSNIDTNRVVVKNYLDEF
jgi:hypothetical protein